MVGRTATRRIRGLAPIAAPTARLLILGSMPGEASLRAQQYYAHPQNAFWTIMGELIGASPDAPYEARTRLLVEQGIALWDVLKACRRPGSLDASIRDEEPNDFAAFFRAHPRIVRIGLNGAKAAEAFRRHAAAALPPGVDLVRLPSTSPAHARMRLAEKRAAWRAGLKL